MDRFLHDCTWWYFLNTTLEDLSLTTAGCDAGLVVPLSSFRVAISKALLFHLYKLLSDLWYKIRTQFLFVMLCLTCPFSLAVHFPAPHHFIFWECFSVFFDTPKLCSLLSPRAVVLYKRTVWTEQLFRGSVVWWSIWGFRYTVEWGGAGILTLSNISLPLRCLASKWDSQP